MGASVILKDEAATQHFAMQVAAVARPGDAILLSGPLGAGKSVFARAFLRALCENPALDVPSPTYTLVQTYDAPLCAVSHFDLWRLGGPDELEELGWEEARDGIVLVEWPERLEDLTPDDALHLGVSVLAGGDRQVSIKGWSQRFDAAGLSLGPETSV
ncbi:tRNA (adenosine(37)-N6)-threonylcarbamoyltransferase complex ATPase subunit type 1 TsaE [Acetobacter tropicalis]|uniref:tRNA threonylcarbamoyladenosine biosynthesis protein TsaE n=1 Tax=Acetobacter tropicalis TaxID=104102 RepID=A0A252AB36_9PROT|nr:tRNA (adenosine(37)-N6)-threonylcarbamoyltransferase complex ATPase subunit type 1 TsaE [Acetobacter tropicalis]OUI86789.1 ATP/GTP hydrolase [Acetobacter tropicalis]